MRNKKILSLLAVGALALGACGGDDDDSGSPPAASPDPAGDDGSARIVSLSPTATEMLFAIGAGDQVVAVDDQSDYPPEVPATDLSGYEPNVEAIAGYEPDLVVASDDAIGAELDALDIELLALPAAASLDEAYTQIEQLGELTGHSDEATEVVDGMKADIEEILADLPEPERDVLTYYHELDDTYYSVSSNTFIGQIYALAGLTSIGDGAGDGSDYPQLSSEYIVEQDPDLIFLADTECCQQSAETVAARPAWDSLGAVTNGNVVELSDDVASRWGPRVVDLLRTVVEAAAAARAA